MSGDHNAHQKANHLIKSLLLIKPAKQALAMPCLCITGQRACCARLILTFMAIVLIAWLKLPSEG